MDNQRTQHRVSLASLEAYVTYHTTYDDRTQFITTGAKRMVTDTVLADLCGTTRAAIGRWRRSGIPVYSADRVANRLGVHPAFVWGDELYTDLMEDICA